MQIKLNLKAFYDYIRRFRQVKSNVGPLKKGKHYYSGPKAMVEILSAQYESAFSYILDHYDHDHIREASCSPLTDITFSMEDIFGCHKRHARGRCPWPRRHTGIFIQDLCSRTGSPAPLHMENITRQGKDARGS